MTPSAVDTMKVHRFTGEFAHPADEAAFLQHHVPQTRALLGFTLVFCTLFYVAFVVTDYAALGLLYRKPTRIGREPARLRASWFGV